MEGYKFIKPKTKDLIVRDPISRTPLSADGEEKPILGKEGTYWLRRINDGSCIIVEKQSTEKIIKKGGKFND